LNKLNTNEPVYLNTYTAEENKDEDRKYNIVHSNNSYSKLDNNTKISSNTNNTNNIYSNASKEKIKITNSISNTSTNNLNNTNNTNSVYGVNKIGIQSIKQNKPFPKEYTREMLVTEPNAPIEREKSASKQGFSSSINKTKTKVAEHSSEKNINKISSHNSVIRPSTSTNTTNSVLNHKLTPKTAEKKMFDKSINDKANNNTNNNTPSNQLTSHYIKDFKKLNTNVKIKLDNLLLKPSATSTASMMSKLKK